MSGGGFERGQLKQPSPGNRGGQFDSVFAPPAGLEPATRSSTRLAIPLIEDIIRFPHVVCRNKEKEEPHQSRSPICNLALVAFAF
jgi:hypothetical protein